MGFALCPDAAAAAWLLEQDLPWQRLAARGPTGYPKYARLRFVPDPRLPGQSLNDVHFDQPELSEKQQGDAADPPSRLLAAARHAGGLRGLEQRRPRTVAVR